MTSVENMSENRLGPLAAHWVADVLQYCEIGPVCYDFRINPLPSLAGHKLNIREQKKRNSLVAADLSGLYLSCCFEIFCFVL